MSSNGATTQEWDRLSRQFKAIESPMEEAHSLLDAELADAINPNHYKAGNVECIEAIQESLTAEAFAGYLKGNVQKYLWRYETKHWEDPLQDLQKAEWYLARLIALVGEDYE